MITKTVRIALSTAAAAALLAAADASAQTTVSSTFDVRASVASKCVIDAAADIDITAPGIPWDPTAGTNETGTGTITVRCTRGTNYTVDVNGGVYGATMLHTNGTDTLPYRFYLDDCTTPFAAISRQSTSRQAFDHTICAGVVFGDATVDPIAGDYVDTVTVDVTF